MNDESAIDEEMVVESFDHQEDLSGSFVDQSIVEVVSRVRKINECRLPKFLQQQVLSIEDVEPSEVALELVLADQELLNKVATVGRQLTNGHLMLILYIAIQIILEIVCLLGTLTRLQGCYVVAKAVSDSWILYLLVVLLYRHSSYGTKEIIQDLYEQGNGVNMSQRQTIENLRHNATHIQMIQFIISKNQGIVSQLTFLAIMYSALCFIALSLTMFDQRHIGNIENNALLPLIMTHALPILSCITAVTLMLLLGTAYFLVTFIASVVNITIILLLFGFSHLASLIQRFKRQRQYTSFQESLQTRTLDEVEQDQQCCAICLQDYVVADLVTIIPCQVPTLSRDINHYFHKECIELWLTEHLSCPICRKRFVA